MIINGTCLRSGGTILLVWMMLAGAGFSSLSASTIAYWRFEEGLDGSAVADTDGKTVYRPGAADASSNGNVLCAWDSRRGGQRYRAEVPQSTVPATGQGDTLAMEGGRFAEAAHRYSFNVEGQAEDSLGAADLTLNGAATVTGGALVLPGGGTRTHNASAAGAALAELAATINGADQLTIEAWFTQSVAAGWAKLFMAGSSEQNYLDMTPRRGADNNVGSCCFRNSSIEVRSVLPDGSQVVNGIEYYMAAVWDEPSGSMRIYLVRAGDPSSAVMATGSLSGKDLASLILSEFYLGSAVHFNDPDFIGQINEFRIYPAALSAFQMAANMAAGPDTLITADESGCLFTWSDQSHPSGTDLQAITPFQWTIEASIRVDAIGGYQTFVGREGANVAGEDPALAPLYFQVLPDGRIQIAFADVSGRFHRLQSQAPVQPGSWYHAAAVSDGSAIKLYLNNELDGYLSLGAGGTSLAKDSDVGGWTVFCGTFNSHFTDYFDGLIDEIRISDEALLPQEFLFWKTHVGSLLVDRERVVLSEQGPTFEQVAIALEFEPLADVTVTLENAAADQVAFNPSPLVFTPVKWAVPQAVTVTAVDDGLPESLNHLARVDAMMASSDPSYNRVQPGLVWVLIGDNDCGHWGYPPGDINRDCLTNINDLVEMSIHWLSCSLPDTAGCTGF